jgi:hypothetical protein
MISLSARAQIDVLGVGLRSECLLVVEGCGGGNEFGKFRAKGAHASADTAMW